MKKLLGACFLWTALLLALCSGCGQILPDLESQREESSSSLAVFSSSCAQQAPGPELLGFAVSYCPSGWEGDSLFSWCNRVMTDPQWSAFATGPKGTVEVAGDTLLDGWPCRLRLVFSADREEKSLSLSQALEDGEPADYTLEELWELCRLPKAE